MVTLASSSPFFEFKLATKPYCFSSRTSAQNPRVSVKPPPPGFDYRWETIDDSRETVAEKYPELEDLVENGTLVLIQRNRFGSMRRHRIEYFEPEMVWIVGTSHLSEQSAVDVDRVVKAVEPENVVVELCRSRAGIMYSSNDGETAPLLRSNMFSLSGGGLLGAVGRSLNLGGQTALALRLLLAVFSSKISSNAGRPFGDEFRAACKASEEVGAQLVLGDRPIEITLGRAWASLKWDEKLRLVISLLRGIIFPLSDMSRSNVKDQDMDGSPFKLYKELSLSYPSLLQPLILERDVYLAWSLKRSKAVNNSKRVVGVIGKSHMNGVIYALMNDQGDLHFRDLVGKRPSDGTSNDWIDSLVKSLVRDTVIGILIWALFEQLKPGL